MCVWKDRLTEPEQIDQIIIDSIPNKSTSDHDNKRFRSFYLSNQEIETQTSSSDKALDSWQLEKWQVFGFHSEREMDWHRPMIVEDMHHISCQKKTFHEHDTTLLIFLSSPFCPLPHTCASASSLCFIWELAFESYLSGQRDLQRNYRESQSNQSNMHTHTSYTT
jgi:hypothetical protein